MVKEFNILYIMVKKKFNGNFGTQCLMKYLSILKSNNGFVYKVDH